ncbi:4277_t:CDS:2, partial [Funneliformis mosseae]
MINEVHELISAKQIKKPSLFFIKTDDTEDDGIFDYNNLLIENKENFNENNGDNELLKESDD